LSDDSNNTAGGGMHSI